MALYTPKSTNENGTSDGIVTTPKSLLLTPPQAFMKAWLLNHGVIGYTISRVIRYAPSVRVHHDVLLGEDAPTFFRLVIVF